MALRWAALFIANPLATLASPPIRPAAAFELGWFSFMPANLLEHKQACKINLAT